MSELYTKSMKKLELDAVLQRLSEQAVSQEAKARCLAYQPLRIHRRDRRQRQRRAYQHPAAYAPAER